MLLDYFILNMTTGFYTHKIVCDKIFNIFHKITHISFNIGLRMLNLHTLGHTFPLAGHILLRTLSGGENTFEFGQP